MVFCNMVYNPNPNSSSSSTHKGHSLQGRKSPVNNSNQRRNSASTHSPKSVSPPHRQQEPVSSSSSPRGNCNVDSSRKLERAMSEPADRRAAAAQSNSSRYKTELCRPFEESGTCKYGDKCQFAHGVKELRTLARHPKYKTELCRSFHTTGLCPYGPRCHFIHNSDQTKATIFSSLSGIAPNQPPSRPKALSSSSLGSSGEISPPSSHSGSPTLLKSSDDLFQFPAPAAFPFSPEFPSPPTSNMNLQRGYLDYTTHEFNPDYYDTSSIFQERILSSVFGSSVSLSSDGVDLDPSSLCGSPTLELFQQPNTPTSLDTSPGFVPFPVFNLFGKQEH